MEINIKGNPGTGNTFQEIHIEHADSVNPNATTVAVTHNHYNDKREAPRAKTEVPRVDTAPIRAEILSYVSSTRPFLKDEWKDRFMRLWEGILDLRDISAVVYNPGKQKDTNFNRDLVANIIHYLNGKGLYRENGNPTALAMALEGSKDHSVRRSLANDPTAAVTSRLNSFMDTFEL